MDFSGWICCVLVGISKLLDLLNAMCPSNHCATFGYSSITEQNLPWQASTFEMQLAIYVLISPECAYCQRRFARQFICSHTSVLEIYFQMEWTGCMSFTLRCLEGCRIPFYPKSFDGLGHHTIRGVRICIYLGPLISVRQSWAGRGHRKHMIYRCRKPMMASKRCL